MYFCKFGSREDTKLLFRVLSCACPWSHRARLFKWRPVGHMRSRSSLWVAQPEKQRKTKKNMLCELYWHSMQHSTWQHSAHDAARCCENVSSSGSLMIRPLKTCLYRPWIVKLTMKMSGPTNTCLFYLQIKMPDQCVWFAVSASWYLNGNKD